MILPTISIPCHFFYYLNISDTPNSVPYEFYCLCLLSSPYSVMQFILVFMFYEQILLLVLVSLTLPHILYNISDITMKLIEDLALPINSGSTLSKEERCYIGLWYLANNCPYRLLAEQYVYILNWQYLLAPSFLLIKIHYLLHRFSISKSTAHEVVTEFMQSIICKLRTQSSLPTIADTGPCTLPGCVGYVDGQYIVLS